MDRWSVCPGSVRECKNRPNPTTEHAARGTLAHKIGEDCLRKGGDAAAYIGEKHTVEGHELTFNEEDAAAVQVYVDHVRWRKANAAPGVLYVTDYKHGSGKFVDAQDNNQLKYYAYGALVTLSTAKDTPGKVYTLIEHKFDLAHIFAGLYGTADCVQYVGGFKTDTVEITIVQPRCEIGEPVRSQTIRAIDLLDFSSELIEFAKATQAPDAPLVPGPHCRGTWCPAQATCPALKDRANAVAAQVFSMVPSGKVPVTAITFSPEQLGKILHELPMLEARIKALREFAYTVAEKTPGAIPGWKLVDKVARRKWVDHAGHTLELEGIAPYAPPALRGITDIGIELKNKGYSVAEREQLINSLTTKESSGHTLAPDDDKRPAVPKQLASEVFANV